MVIIKYNSIDKVNRMVTFDIDGALVSREVAEHIDDTSIDDHITALKNGLTVEYDIPSKTITKVKYSKGDILYETPVEVV